MASFDEMQRLFIAKELISLGYAIDKGQVLQPAFAALENDASLWKYFNTIPTYSQVYASSGEEFFTVYSELIDSLIPGDNALDPIVAAKKRLANWGHRPPAWNVGHTGFMGQLSNAPSSSFEFDNKSAPESIFWGLWSNSLPVSGESSRFASGDVSAKVFFSKALSFSPTPGDWYVSSALSLAYSSHSGLPWNPESPINWQTTFGPNGKMQRFLTALLAVSGMDIQFQSSALFSADDQALILQNAHKGLWPYYLDADKANTDVEFDKAGRIAVTITSRPGVPIIIAGNVLSAGQFLGE